MNFNPDIHYRQSIRLKEYDYSTNGYYFVTICVQDRKCLFGEIINGKNQLSKIGEIVKKYWCEIPKHFNGISIDVFIVMPNHFHGIVIIGNDRNVSRRGVACNAPTNKMSFISPKDGTLSTIIRSFKSVVTKYCHENNFIYFQWQRNYYEHIIRDENEFKRIREYIILNPLQWEFDRNNPRFIKPKRKIGFYTN